MKWDQEGVSKPEGNNKDRTVYDQLLAADGKDRKAKKAKTLEA